MATTTPEPFAQYSVAATCAREALKEQKYPHADSSKVSPGHAKASASDSFYFADRAAQTGWKELTLSWLRYRIGAGEASLVSSEWGRALHFPWFAGCAKTIGGALLVSFLSGSNVAMRAIVFLLLAGLHAGKHFSFAGYAKTSEARHKRHVSFELTLVTQ